MTSRTARVVAKLSVTMCVAGVLLVVTTTVLAALGVRDVFADRARAEATLARDTQLVTDALATALTLPLWNFDRPQIERLVEGAMERRDVEAVIVRQLDVSAEGGFVVYGRARDEHWNAVAWAKPPAAPDALSYRRDIVVDVGPLGSVSVQATRRFIDDDARRELRASITKIAIVDGVLILSIYFLLRRIILRPLLAVERLAQEVREAAGRPSVDDAFVPPERRALPPLLGELASLRTSLDDTFAHLDARYAALRESEEKYRLLAENVADVIWVLDREAHFVYVSPSVVRLLGLTPDAARARTIAEHLAPASEQRFLAVLEALTRQPSVATPTVLELELRRADDSTVWTETTVSPILDAAGTYSGVLASTRDISERKRAEAEREGLERQVRQAQKLEALGTLAGGIAHDFNNILSAILGYGELIMAELPRGSHLAEDMKAVMTAAHRAGALVRQILAFSRKHQPEARPMDLGAVVKEALSLLRATLPVTVTLEQHLGRVIVVADPTEVHQVVMNLCTNAWLAMRERGSGTITVRVAMEDGPDDRPCGVLTVKDDGSGMPPEVLDRIFDPFFTTRNEGEGTGLGLAVVHGIVTKAGGSIAVSSEVGRGTEFVVTVPAADAPAATWVAPPEPARGEERVIVVDDERSIAETLERRLAPLGYRVRAFTSATAALAAVRDAPAGVDVVVTDLTMPAMTGTEFADALRTLRPDLPVVVCTGSEESVPAAWLNDRPRVRVLAKPVAVHALTGAIRSLVDPPT